MKKRTKLLSIILSVVMLLSLNVSALAYEVEVPNDSEIVLNLDENGRAEVSMEFVTQDGQLKFFEPDDSAETISPRATGLMHVGIEMVGSQYRLYYYVTGTSIYSVKGYMQCKSAALFSSKMYFSQYINHSSIGLPRLEGESQTFSLPSGTSKVKVGWSDVTIKDADGTANIADKFATVNVG